jgi:DNA replication protein DnaC
MNVRAQPWGCPAKGCRFRTAADSRDEWDELYRHLQREHGLDSDRARDVTHAYDKRRHRQENVSRLRSGRRRMHDFTLDSFPADDVAGRRARKQVRQWFEDEEAFTSRVYVYGPPGTGKTGLIYAACWRWIHLDIEFPEWGADFQDFRTLHFWNVRDLLAEERRRMSRGDPTSLIEPLLDPHTLVVLDDLGAERPTDWALETIALIVERRYDENAQTFVTSNYKPSDLAARMGHQDLVIGQRIVSRLLDGATVVNLDRGDLRRARTAA